jgi:hypothetical protein
MDEQEKTAVLSVLAEIDALFGELIAQQRAKVLRLAREAVPDITPDDVLNPHDFPALKAHPSFEFEDGILSGYIAAQTAVRARVVVKHRLGPRPEPA